jgi:hypothetical protein
LNKEVRNTQRGDPDQSNRITEDHKDNESSEGLTPEPGEFNNDDTTYPPELYLDPSQEDVHSNSTVTAEVAEDHDPSVEDSGNSDDHTSEPESENSSEESDEVEEEPENTDSPENQNSPQHSTTPSHHAQKSYIAICAALKDIPQDLPEWLIHHYFHLQIGTFYIMDDGSTPPLSNYPIPSSIPTESVVFDYQYKEQRTGSHSQQLTIYSRCIEKWGHLHTWMVFIDGDEFLEMTNPGKNETFPQLLEEFENEPNVGALAVNWRMHTSSGYLTRPDSVRQAFIHCIWDGPESNNSHVKSIVRTEFADRPVNPHLWYLKEGRATVGEKGDVVDSEAFRIPISRERVGLHHYAGKSRQEYEEKMGRGNAMDGEF